jgi:AcrR family transcriptional regulator
MRKTSYLVKKPRHWYDYQMPAKFALPTTSSLPANASTRTRILTASVEVLHTEGLASLTQHAVADKAGVRQSHVTYYFPTRLDLLQATAQFGCEYMMQPISNAAASGELSFDEFRNLLLPDATDRGWWRLMTALVNASSESDNIRAWIVQFDGQLMLRLAAGFAAFGIVLTKLDIEFLHATYIGALTLDMQQQTDESLTRAVDIVNLAVDLLVAKAARNSIREPNVSKATRQRTAPSPPPPSARKAVVSESRVRSFTRSAKSS